MAGWGWNRGKKKEERIKRRVPVDLPIDNGFHLYNSTPRATLNPFCLFSLMLFYHPFAAVFHVSPITCHPRTYALFFRQNSLSSPSASGKNSFDVFALTFCFCCQRYISVSISACVSSLQICQCLRECIISMYRVTSSTPSLV